MEWFFRVFFGMFRSGFQFQKNFMKKREKNLIKFNFMVNRVVVAMLVIH